MSRGVFDHPAGFSFNFVSLWASAAKYTDTLLVVCATQVLVKDQILHLASRLSRDISAREEWLFLHGQPMSQLMLLHGWQGQSSFSGKGWFAAPSSLANLRSCWHHTILDCQICQQQCCNIWLISNISCYKSKIMAIFRSQNATYIVAQLHINAILWPCQTPKTPNC